jgi:hypothetical protein
MADVQVSLSFTGQEDVTQAAAKVEDAIKRVGKGQLKAEEDLKALIARDDPGKEAQRRRDREIQRIAQHVSKHRDLTAQGELARKQVVERYEREIAQIRVNAADRSAQAVVAKMRPALSNIVQLTNAVGNAAGASASKFTALATGVAGAFGSGNLAYVAVAAFGGILATVVSKFTEMQDAAKAASDAVRQRFAERKKEAQDLASEYQRAAQLQAFLLTGGTEAQFNANQKQQAALGTFGATAGELGRVGGDLTRLAARRAALGQERLPTGAAGERAALAQAGRIADLNKQIEELRKRYVELAIQLGKDKLNEMASRGFLEDQGPPAPSFDNGGISRGRGGPRGTNFNFGAALTEDIGRTPEGMQRRMFDAAMDQQRVRGMVADDATEDAKRVGKLRAKAEAKAHEEALKEEARNEKFAMAGIAAGGQFISGFRQIIEGQDTGASIFGLFTSALGMVLSLANPAAGAAFSTFTGAAFRNGGGFIPQGRAGLGNPGNDARLAFMHPREVIMSAPAVEAMGGMDGALRFNEAARSGRPMRTGGGGNLTLVLPTMLPQDAAAAVKQVVRPGFETVLSNRQSGAMLHELQRAVQRPRAS